MTIIINLLVLLGSLGIFIFGMKTMSEGVQKVAGSKLRQLIRTTISTPLLGVITGTIITAITQSSSATSVMIVSFTNAGLMSLAEAISVTMGANIGTTVTGWFLAALGYNASIKTFSIIVIGLSLPLLFSKRAKLKSIGEAIIGFGLLFIGLYFLKSNIPDPIENPALLEFVKDFAQTGFISNFIFLAIGCLVTMIIQSSSAAMALTIVLLAQGWINFESATAMLIGENIGTTITANLAASIANIHAKRAARFHTLFNIIGACWILIILPWFSQLVLTIIQPAINFSARIFGHAIIDNTQLAGLALFHTLFNLLNTILLFAFIPLLENLVMKLFPGRGTDEDFKLKHIPSVVVGTSEMNIAEVKKELIEFSKIVSMMYGNIMMLLFEDGNDKVRLREKIRMREEITDNLEEEICNFLAKIGSTNLSERGAKKVKSMFSMVDDLERMADIFFRLSFNHEKMENENLVFPQIMKKEMESIYDLVNQAIKKMNENMLVSSDHIDMESVMNLEKEINQLRGKLVEGHYNNQLSKKNYAAKMGILFLDFINSAERIGDLVVNVNEGLAGIK